MLLYEFTAVDPLLVSLVATIGQLKSSIEAGNEKPDWNVDELLEYLKQNNVIIDQSDLYDMIKEPPLSNSISNIQGNRVIFKGQETIDTEQDADKNRDIVKGMAHRAAQ